MPRNPSRPAGAVNRPGSQVAPSRFWRPMRAVALILLALCLDAAVGSADEWIRRKGGCTQENPCAFHVHRANIIQLGSNAYRLCGITVPEVGTALEMEARAFLTQELLKRNSPNGANEAFLCLPVGHSTPCDANLPRPRGNFGPAQCFIGADDVADILVEHGYAQDYAPESNGYYRREL